MHTFTKVIGPKEYVIARLEVELAYFETAVENFMLIFDESDNFLALLKIIHKIGAVFWLS